MAPKDKKEAPSFNVGDLCLGRIKGYPPWPAKIVDPEVEYLKKEVLAAKKGKKTNLLVRYYPDATYSWASAGELKPLSRKEIEEYVQSKDKGGKAPLLVAYKTAMDPTTWETEHEATMDNLRQNGAEDELDEEDDDEPDSKGAATGSKRKAGKGRAVNAKKAKPAPKTKAADGKKADGKKKDEPLEEGEKKCKDWRHKLQRGFLGKTMPKPEQMPDFDAMFTEMEGFTFQGEWLTSTKLPKVLRRIHNLEAIPREGDFHIKKRAGDLVEQWKSLVPEGKEGDDAENASPTTAAAPPAPKETNGETNGTAGDATAQVEDQPMAVDEPAKAEGEAAPSQETVGKEEAAAEVPKADGEEDMAVDA